MTSPAARTVSMTNLLSAYLLLGVIGLWIGVAGDPGPTSNPIELRPATVQPHSPDRLEHRGESDIRLLFAGDIMQHRAQRYDDFNASYAPVAPLIEKADLTIANLEFPVHTLKPVGPEAGSVQFNGSVEHVRALAEAGLDVLVTANNHAFDQGVEGLSQTLRVIQRTGMTPLGTADSEAELDRPRVFPVKGIWIGMVAYTYGVNPVVNGPGEIDYLPRDLPLYTLNFFEWSGVWRDQGKEMIQQHVKRARVAGAEYLVAYCHWGEEWDFSPSEYQRAAAHDLIDEGFDLVVGSHGHVLQGPEVYKGKLVAYSLGSLISDFRPWEVRTAALLEVGLAREEGKVVTVDFAYHPTLVEAPGHQVVLLDETSQGMRRQAYELSRRVLRSRRPAVPAADQTASGRNGDSRSR